MVYKIKPTLMDYHGCGKAWAAIKDGEILAIRYMSRAVLDGPNIDSLDDITKAILNVVHPLSYSNTSFISSRKLNLAYKAAVAAGMKPTGPRGGFVRRREMVNKAFQLYHAANKKDFEIYRFNCLNELLQFSNAIISGCCSCYEFITNGE